MSNPMPSIQVTLKVLPPLSWLVEDLSEGKILQTFLVRRLKQSLTQHLQDWITVMGIAAQPEIVIQAQDLRCKEPELSHFQSLRFSIWVNHYRCPYSRQSINLGYKNIHKQVLRGDALSLKESFFWMFQAFKPPSKTDFEAKKKQKINVIDFMALLASEAIINSADKFINADITNAFISSQLNSESSEKLDIQQKTENILKTLLSAHIPISKQSQTQTQTQTQTHQSLITKKIIQSQKEKHSEPIIGEELYDLLRPGVIDICIHPKVLSFFLGNKPVDPRAVFRVDELNGSYAASLKDGLQHLHDTLFNRWGIHLQEVRLRAKEKLLENTFQFCFNHRQTIPQPMVSTSIEGLSYLLSSLDYFLERTQSPFTIPSVDDVEYLLAQLDTSAPALVKAAYLNGWPPLKLTQVLRHLLRQQISIRDLSTIIEALLEFDTLSEAGFTSGIRIPTSVQEALEPTLNLGEINLKGSPYFNESNPYLPQLSLSPFQLFIDPLEAWKTDYRLAAEFVKCKLNKQITYRLSQYDDSGTLMLPCYLLQPQIEVTLLDYLQGLSQNLTDTSLAPLKQEITNKLLTGIADTIQDKPLDAPVLPLLIASTPDVAIVIQDMMAADFPEIQVLHRQMLDPSVQIVIKSQIPQLDD